MSKRSYLAIPILAALVATFPARLSAQSVAGTVHGGDLAGGALAGAFVSLVDASDAQVDATFTDAGGAFRFEAPSSGTYHVRVQRIGYASWESGAYALISGRTESVSIFVPLDPIALADLDVTVVRGCVREPSQTGALADVWEEARKALETAVWACVVRMIRAPTCPAGADVYVDGTRVIAGDGTERSLLSLDEVVMPSEVAAIEIYTGASTMPAEYGGSSGQCGAVVIWTK